MGKAKDRRMGWLRIACLCGAAMGVAGPAGARQIMLNATTVDVSSGDVEEAPAGNGFSIKKEDQKLIEQFEDFERYRDKKLWDKAFKALDTFSATADPNAMAPAKDGFWIPTRQKFLRSLLSLPADGKEAYRLFNDAKARQQWEQALAHETAGDADNVALLKKLVNQFFITSVGDKAADHLGDALFEAGDYIGAAQAWEQVLRFYPETSVAPLRLKMKQATALARAGRWDAFRQVSASIREKHAGESLRIAGKDVSVEAHLNSLARPTTQPTTAVSTEPALPTTPFSLPARDHPVWQMQFLDQSLADKIFSQINQNGWGAQMAPMARVVPAAVTDGKRVYLNWYGIIWAIDAQTGKLVWWSSHFKKLAEKFNELTQWQVDARRFTIAMAGDSLLVISVNLDKLNNQEPFRLTSIEPETGKRKWSSDTGALQNWAFIGSPLVVDSTIYITAHPKDTQEIHILALSLDGKLLWESKLGQPQIGNNWRGMPIYPLPLLQYSAGMLYVLTNNGAVIAFDTAGRNIEWAFSYEKPLTQNQNYNQPEPADAPATAWLREGLLYFKDRGTRDMYALDLGGPALKWKRPLGADTSLAGFDEKNFYLLATGPDNTSLSTVDFQSGMMLKSSKLPDANDNVRAMIAGTSYLMFLSRGIFEVDTAVEDVTRDTKNFRGIDRDSLGGVLLRAGDKLITISNLSVTAYPVGPAARAAK